MLMESKVLTESGAHTAMDIVTECSSSTAVQLVDLNVPRAKLHQITLTGNIRPSSSTALPTKFSPEYKAFTSTVEKIAPGSFVAVDPQAMSLPTVN